LGRNTSTDPVYMSGMLRLVYMALVMPPHNRNYYSANTTVRGRTIGIRRDLLVTVSGCR
jgi:hypothetical protein